MSIQNEQLIDVHRPVFVFDIGGVLACTNPSQRDDFLLRCGSVAYSGRRFSEVDPNVLMQFRLGQMTVSSYLKYLSGFFGIDIATAQKADEALIVGKNESLCAFVDNLRKSFRVVCLSNNQPIHWSVLNTGRYSIPALVHHSYLSHELGLEKPNSDIFQLVERREKVSTSQLVLVDDNIDNVNAALSCGWSASFQHISDSDTLMRLGEFLTRPKNKSLESPVILG